MSWRNLNDFFSFFGAYEGNKAFTESYWREDLQKWSWNVLNDFISYSGQIFKQNPLSKWPRLSKDKIPAFLGEKYIFFQLFKVKKDMFFQSAVQKLFSSPFESRSVLEFLEYSYIIRVRIVGNEGNENIHLHISKAYLKALAKALWYIKSLAGV